VAAHAPRDRERRFSDDGDDDGDDDCGGRPRFLAWRSSSDAVLPGGAKEAASEIDNAIANNNAAAGGIYRSLQIISSDVTA